VAALALVPAACGDGGGADPEAFCAAFEDLREDDPFAELTVASPGEMRDAFDRLADGAEGMADAAPDEADVQADRYAAAVDALREEMAGAGYALTQLDRDRYGDAVREYQRAADSLANAARAVCR